MANYGAVVSYNPLICASRCLAQAPFFSVKISLLTPYQAHSRELKPDGTGARARPDPKEPDVSSIGPQKINTEEFVGRIVLNNEAP